MKQEKIVFEITLPAGMSRTGEGANAFSAEAKGVLLELIEKHLKTTMMVLDDFIIPEEVKHGGG